MAALRLDWLFRMRDGGNDSSRQKDEGMHLLCSSRTCPFSLEFFKAKHLTDQ